MNPHFVSLVLGLAQQAEAALAAEPKDQADGRAVARTLIDTLAMLAEKTQGHLDPEEQRLLDQTLTALRFRFVRATAGRS